MRFSNELKVGTTIVVSALIFILGVRFFEDLPLFRGTRDLETSFQDVGGLIAGNVVRINGVNVGSVTRVWVDADSARVRFQVDSEISIPEGSYTQVSGFDALGVVRMDLHLGPDPTRLIQGSFVSGKSTSDLLSGFLGDRVSLLDDMEGVFDNLTATLGETRTLLSDPEGDFRGTLTGVHGGITTLNQILRTEQARLSRVLENAAQLTDNLNRFAGENSDSISTAIHNLNQLFVRLDHNLAALETTTKGLDTLLVKINRGDGTLGLLVNDPTLYHRLHTTLDLVDSLLIDFQDDPARYLRELRLVDIF